MESKMERGNIRLLYEAGKDRFELYEALGGEYHPEKHPHAGAPIQRGVWSFVIQVINEHEAKKAQNLT